MEPILTDLAEKERRAAGAVMWWLTHDPPVSLRDLPRLRETSGTDIPLDDLETAWHFIMHYGLALLDLDGGLFPFHRSKLVGGLFAPIVEV